MKLSWRFLAAAMGLFLLLLAVFLAVFPASPPPATPQASAPAQIGILVIRRDLPAGAQIGTGDVEWHRLAQNDAPAGTITRSSGGEAGVIGSFTRRPLVAGQALRQDDLLQDTRESPLAQLLNPGTRAVTVPLDNAQTLAGLLHTNDHVDILCMAGGGGSSIIPGLGAGAGAAAAPPGADLFDNVRVLAVNGQIGGPDPAKSSDGPSILHGVTSATITVELSASDAARLARKAVGGTVVIMPRRRIEPAARAAAPSPDAATPPTATPGAGHAGHAHARSHTLPPALAPMGSPVAPATAPGANSPLVIRGET